jgi:hypothetical protein
LTKAHTTIAATDHLQADTLTTRKKEQEEHAGLVVELHATITDVTLQAIQLKEDHETAVAAMTVEHDEVTGGPLRPRWT